MYKCTALAPSTGLALLYIYMNVCVHVHVYIHVQMYCTCTIYWCSIVVHFPKALEKAFFLHEKGQGEEAKFQYLQLAQALEEYIGKLFNEWIVTVEKDLGKYLDRPLIVKLVSTLVHVSSIY